MKKLRYAALAAFIVAFVVTNAMLTLADAQHRCYDILAMNGNNCDLTVSGTSAWKVVGNPGIPEASSISSINVWDMYVKIRAWDNHSSCPAPTVVKDVCKSVDFSQNPSCRSEYAVFGAKPPGIDYYTTKHKWSFSQFGDSFYTSASGAHGTYGYWVGALRPGCQADPDPD